MTTLREAATQALEALEDFGMKYYENTGEVLHRDVYESLKAALAEEALQRLTDVSQEIEAALAEPVQEPQCNPHPKAPHGFLRNASHTEDRYVCECEGWEPYEAGYQSGMEAALRAQS